jgi:hypothetical protein
MESQLTSVTGCETLRKPKGPSASSQNAEKRRRARLATTTPEAAHDVSFKDLLPMFFIL